MKADEAKKITEQNLKGASIEPLLKVAYERIREFAMQGKSSVPHPFHGIWAPNKAVIKAAIQHLQNEGYSAEYHDTTSYWELSW